MELNGPEEDCSGIQITLFDDEASVTVPFWHEGDKAADTLREIWIYLEIISRQADYLIYDPQIDRILDPSAGIDDALACYSSAMRQIPQNIVSQQQCREKAIVEVLVVELQEERDNSEPHLSAQHAGLA